MSTFFTFDDVLIEPKFSTVKSRKDVDISSPVFGLRVPIFSANMDSITEAHMCKSLSKVGAGGVLHRFCSVEDNIREYLKLNEYERTFTSVSVGLGKQEFERFEALRAVGANRFFIDVAHGASVSVVEQFNSMIKSEPNSEIIVGNFATGKSIRDFLQLTDKTPFAFKTGVGPSAVCSTRTVTGVGFPQLSAVIDCVNAVAGNKLTIIADGGIKNSGDVAKALGAGAHAVMIGGMIAGTTETPGPVSYNDSGACKVYRGSASAESYQKQHKVALWRSPEGVSRTVRFKGSVIPIINQIEGGLRSSFSYVGAFNLSEFHTNVNFLKITSSTVLENKSYG